ncbi:hypothetical protein GCM10027447_09970 [Glycomyces halotolerans]
MFSGTRLALRIARREALRYKGRSALSIALLGIPLLGVSIAATGYDTIRLSDVENAEQRLGETDAYITFDWEGVPLVQQNWTEQWPWTRPAESGAHHEGREVTEDEVLAALPDGSSIAPFNHNGFDGGIQVETPDGIGGIATAGYDLSDPIYEAANLRYLEGAPPRGDQIVLSETAAEYLEKGVGDTVALADGSDEYTVSGLVELPWNLDDAYAIGTVFEPGAAGWLVDAPGTLAHEDALALNELGMSVWATSLVKDPPPTEEVYQGFSPSDGVDGAMMMVFGLIVTVVVVEVVLLAGPAFAISARRRSREFALMSAAGAAPKHLRNTVLAGGLLFGIIAAVVAVTVGVLAVWALQPALEQFFGHRSAGLKVMPLMQAMLVGFAIVTGLLSALAAALSSSRINVVAALAGRTPRRKVRKRWPLIGLTLVGLGVASGFAGVALWSLPLMSVGIVAIQFGLIACTPTLVALIAKLGRRLPLAPRMALREAGRNRGSTAPAIAAVMGVVAAGVAFSLTVAADNVRMEQWRVHDLAQGSLSLDLSGDVWADPAGAPPDLDAAFTEAEQVLERHLEDLEVERIGLYAFGEPCGRADEDTETRCHAELVRPEENRCVYWSMEQDGTEEAAAAAIEAARNDPRCDEKLSNMGAHSDAVPASTDPEIVAAYTELEGEDLQEAVDHLESGGILVSDKWAITDDGTAVIEVTKETWRHDGSEGEDREVTSFEFPAMEVDHGLLGLDQYMPGPEAAERLGMTTSEWNQRYLLDSSTEATRAVQEAIAADLQLRAVDGIWVSFRVTDYTDPFTFYFMLAIAALCGIIALGATAVSTGLIVAESRKDMTTLGAVGAEPSVRKRFAMWQTVVIALLGAGLGTVAGLIGYALIREALNRDLSTSYPFETLYGWELPWANFGISLLVVPLVAALGALLFTRARLPSERRPT